MTVQVRCRGIGRQIVAKGLKRDDVSAISAGFGDVWHGLPRVVAHLAGPLESDDRDVVRLAQVEVDEHLRPHLRDPSRALTKLDRLLKKQSKARRRP